VRNGKICADRVFDKVFDPIMEGIKLDGKEGTVEQLADALSLTRCIGLHNSGERELGPHDPVCLGLQFSEGVRFMCLSTMHFLTNLPRAKNCGWQMQGHFDGSFDFCDEKFAMLGFGLTSPGTHFNPVCLAIVKSESAEAYHWTYKAVSNAVYHSYSEINICAASDCGHPVCPLMKENDRCAFNTLRKNMKSVADKRFPLDKPSSDNSGAFIRFAKGEFSKNTLIQQCSVHFRLIPNLSKHFPKCCRVPKCCKLISQNLSS
jgi:hypothetical protein